jgi:hypothetical protein
MNRDSRSIGLFVGLMMLVVSSPVSGQMPDGANPRLADYFGFLPLEIYKLERRVDNLHIRDIDGDKVADILVANNARSRIDLLLSSKRPKDEPEAHPFRKQVNELEFDQRMRLVSIPVNKEVVSLDVGDFNGDGKPDLVYFGTPAEVEILFNEGPGRFSLGKKVNSGEAVEGPHALAVGDLDRNGRDDIVLIAENELIFIYQNAPGVLTEPERVPHTAGTPRMVRPLDLDGDDKLDLLILDGGTDHPIHVRFGTEERRLGPEQRFAIESPRAITFGQIDGKKGIEILTIEGQSGRGKVLGLDESPNDEFNRWGRLVFFGLPQGSERGRSLAVGDLDGDHRKDVVVTDPSNAQIWLYHQGSRTGLGAGQSFPGLLGSQTARLADLDGDGKDELYVLSVQEKQIAQSTMNEGRISFPKTLPTVGEPMALDVANLDSDQHPDLVYITGAASDRSTSAHSDSYVLRGLKREPSGEFSPYRWGAAGGSDSINIPGLTGAPADLEAFDINHDGVDDVLVFNSYGAPVLLLGRKGEPPHVFSGSLGPMAAATPAGLSVADLKGPAILVAQNTFARRIQLGPNDQWQVKDQYNAGRGTAQVQGAAAIDVNGDGQKEIVLMERTSKSLLFLTLKDGVYRQQGSLAIGSLNFEGLHVADFDGDGRDDLLIAGTDRFGVLQTGRKGQRLKAIASFESRRNEARLADLATADLNADGVPDVVFTDVAEQMLEIASYCGEEKLLPALTFRVFERKLFRGAGDIMEPRDLATGDVDGDGREDLVLIVHDRVLVLRQDPGSKASQPERPPATANRSEEK